MSATIYAVLVGIDEYMGEVQNLQGCVNDVKAMKAFLEQRTQGGDYVLDARLLTSGDPDNAQEIKPSRQAVIDAISTHLTQADEEDIALFYYSGHGGQEKAPPEFWHVEPDHLNETLVFYDSRTEGGWDLADKELAVLIAEVAQKNPHVVVILDSCHSGSGTRAVDGTVARLATTDPRDRPLSTFIPGVVQNQATAKPSSHKPGDWFTLPNGRHVILSACRPEELAREKRLAGHSRRGVFSYYLLDTLQQGGPTLTYRDVFSRLTTLVRNIVTNQNPVLAATRSEDLQYPFLGGAIGKQRPYYHVAFRENQWVMAAGAIHGIAPAEGQETTHVALFPSDHVLTLGDDLSSSIGRATVCEVGGSESLLELAEDVSLNLLQTYKAVIIATPLKRIAVYLEGDDKGALDALATALQNSLIVHIVDDPSAAEIRVVAASDDDRYLLKRAGDRAPLSIVVEQKGTPAAVIAAEAKVEHMAQWMQLLKLSNKQTDLPADAVQMELFRYDPVTDQRIPLDPVAGIHLKYDPKKNRRGIPLQLRLRHTGSYPEKLYCMLVNQSDDFSVNTDKSLFGGGIWLEPGQEVWATKAGRPYIYAYIPRSLRAKGITTIHDVLKLIVSTAESDASLLDQKGLEVVVDLGTRGLGKAKKSLPPSTLHRLMQRFPDRAVGGGEEPILSDWCTSCVSMTTQVVGNEKEVPANKKQFVLLAKGVKLQGHPALKAKAALVSFEEGKRDLGNLALPALFRAHPELAEPFSFRPSRGGDAGQSVVVLRDLNNTIGVTPEEPLILKVEATLEENEMVLAVAFDPQSELFLPLGLGMQRDDAVEIRLERLSAPTADSRDLSGSIKLFFQKLGTQYLGLDSKTSLIRCVARMVDDGRVGDVERLLGGKEARYAKDYALIGLAAALNGLATSGASAVPAFVGLLDPGGR